MFKFKIAKRTLPTSQGKDLGKVGDSAWARRCSGKRLPLVLLLKRQISRSQSRHEFEALSARPARPQAYTAMFGKDKYSIV